ncbi:putative NAD(P)H nitroreductase YodC [Robertmurraya siralis]|uniref:NAD(P)H nitroreductase YodC n=1 Tax=Robertmurraya siralis TaxID=77777 RepID=A0A919WMF7_9BACI|nr:nitroreductase family protein [Robertmurraya siralis]PAE18911.1 nitroreductase family protein [Bacillus sp. 7504-2]GIN64302.1 putative NAD(P)H nitroreductase YodC [Robertmurraya siralis]
MSQLDEIVQQRKSVRSYDPNYTIAKEEIEKLLRLASEAPSSSNLQPWRVIVIKNKELQKELRAIGNNQAQIEESSAVVAILGDSEAYKNAEEIFNQNVAEGHVSQEIANNTIKNTLNFYPNVPEETRKLIAAYDAGAFAMQFMLLAKDRGYDTVTMGGFDKEKFAKRFDLPANVFPITLIAIGKAQAPAFGTSRVPVESFTTFYE